MSEPHLLNLSSRDFPVLFAAHGLQVGAEIGVERGKNTARWLAALPELTLYCIDAWQYWPGYRDRKASRHAGYYEEALARLAPFGERAVIIPEFSVEAAARFADASLDFVFMDACHEYAHVTADLEAWEPKVRPGGIVAGHDFYNRDLGYERVEVEAAVRAWVAEKGILEWFVTPDPSWMWIKSPC